MSTLFSHVLGLDNYQAVAYAQLFNSPKATGDLAGVKVAAYPVGSDTIAESKTSLPSELRSRQKNPM